jgi:isopentenyl-diphosphate Delta-isomerase
VSARTRLDGYLPVRVAGQAGLCPELSLTELLVDGLPDLAAGELAVELLCTDTLTVRLVAEAVDGPGEAGDRRRLLLRVLRFEVDGRSDLVGHLSSLRKASHLGIAAGQDVEAKLARPGWRDWRLPHVALPEAHPDELDLSVELLGKRLSAPILVAGMTGGSQRAGEINRRLARVAQELGLAMGLGSQRAMLEVPALAPTFAVRDVAPDILLLGNIGAVQLNLGVGLDACRWLVEEVGADALAVHLNPLQELVQPEGDRDWRGLLVAIERLTASLGVPVVAKETGAGISGPIAARLRDAGVAAIDVGGCGGTSWGWIEGFRTADPQRQAIAATFRDWGLPSSEALASCRAALGRDFPLIATGGVRSGLDVAVALALGADVAGLALPLFRAADRSAEEALALARRLVEELRIATLLSGAGSCKGLRGLASRVGGAWPR